MRRLRRRKKGKGRLLLGMSTFNDPWEPHQTFDFGKHQGETFEEVHETDQGYCVWALQQREPPTETLRDFQKYLNRSARLDDLTMENDDGTPAERRELVVARLVQRLDRRKRWRREREGYEIMDMLQRCEEKEEREKQPETEQEEDRFRKREDKEEHQGRD